jgi:amino acid adenylation domain-containing protein
MATNIERWNLSCYLSLQAERTPHAPALTSDTRSYDYAALDKQVSDFSAILAAAVPEKQRRIGVYLGDKFSVFIAMLAIFKADLVYVPIDVNLPLDRCRYIIKDSDLAFVVSDPAYAPWLTEGGVSTLLMSTPGPVVVNSRAPAQAHLQSVGHADSEAVAYVLYTSGSTGVPKGVEMPHRAILNLIDDQLESDSLFRLPLRTLQFASPGFDVSCQEVLSSLACGGELVIAPEAVRTDASKLFEFICSRQLQRAFFPYSVLQTLAIEYERQAEGGPGALAHLITAGEQLLMSKEIVHWLSQLKCRLINHYGPTETHVVTTYQSDQPFDRWPYRAPIGKAIGNVQTYVLDERLQPCAIGCEGELYIGGVCLAKGYIQLPDENRAKFVRILAANGEALRVYKTGDIVQIDEDGDLVYKGRSDTQVKLNGHRVELGEVEARLKKMPEVKDAVALVKQLGESSSESILIALVVFGHSLGTERLEINEIDAGAFPRLVDSLPAYMLPKRMYTINRLPLTNNGKLDRRTIDTLLDTKVSAVPFGLSDSETLVAHLFSKLLATSVTLPESNFFEKGGNSLLAVRFIKALEEELGVRINLTRFLLNPTVAYTASLI